MNRYDYLIIGGGIAGVTAAETIREVEPNAAIGIVTVEPHVLYSRVLLPNYLKKKIPRTRVFLRTPEDFTDKRIDLRLNEEVKVVDVERKEVILANQVRLGYHKLLIATGGRLKPWGEEQEQEVIYRLQTLDDADRLFTALNHIKNPLILGSSFISLEFLEIFLIHHKVPTLISNAPHMFGGALETQGGEMVNEHFRRFNVETLFSDSITKIDAAPNIPRSILTHTGKQLLSDAIAVGIGVERTMDFLVGSAVQLSTQGVMVNEFLETNAEDVFAAGDIVEFFDPLLQKRRMLGNWTNAILQGRRAGLNMAGKREPFQVVSTYSITNLGFQYTFMGECDEIQPETETFMRIDEHRHWYQRFFVRKNTLVGAVLINRFVDRAQVSKLIEKKIPIGEHKQYLSTWEFDINSIKI